MEIKIFIFLVIALTWVLLVLLTLQRWLKSKQLLRRNEAVYTLRMNTLGLAALYGKEYGDYGNSPAHPNPFVAYLDEHSYEDMLFQGDLNDYVDEILQLKNIHLGVEKE